MKSLTIEVLEEKMLQIAKGSKPSIQKEYELEQLVKDSRMELKEEMEKILQSLALIINTLRLEDRKAFFGLKKISDIGINRFENILTEGVKITEEDRESLKYVHIDERGYFHIHSECGWINPALEKISKIKLVDKMLTLIIEDEDGIDVEEKIMRVGGDKILHTFKIRQ